ncbi:MAG TPA: hypothetical protein VHO90_03680, partial [Bacteroidales bacterium]|nr:hypothetical protein [Bacteroidales bacterium]
MRFEQLTSERFNFTRHFDVKTLEGFLQLSGTEKRLDNISLLDNLGVLHSYGQKPRLLYER